MPLVVSPTAQTRHVWLAITHGPEMSLTVTRAEELALERDHSGDGAVGS